MSIQSLQIKICKNSIIFQRYQVNDFEENEDDNEKNEPTDSYYVRPFIPFWSLQSLRFEDVNNCNEIPTQRDKMYPRYVMQKLVRTWLNTDKEWFDKKGIFQILEEDIAAMLDSRFTSKKEMRKYHKREYFFNNVLRFKRPIGVRLSL